MNAEQRAALHEAARAVLATQGHDPECRAYARMMAGVHPAAVLALLDECERMRAMLGAAAIQFDYYAKQHAAKGTEDGAAKAKVNIEFAQACRAALEPGA